MKNLDEVIKDLKFNERIVLKLHKKLFAKILTKIRIDIVNAMIK